MKKRGLNLNQYRHPEMRSQVFRELEEALGRERDVDGEAAIAHPADGRHIEITSPNYKTAIFAPEKQNFEPTPGSHFCLGMVPRVEQRCEHLYH